MGATPDPAAVSQDIQGNDDNLRFNELESPNKKRKVTEGDYGHESNTDFTNTSNGNGKIKSRSNMPFVLDSDSESGGEEDSGELALREPTKQGAKEDVPQVMDIGHSIEANIVQDEHKTSGGVTNGPELVLEDGSVQQVPAFEDFEDMENFDPDTFEGEEMRERRFMREQARLEAEEAGFALPEEFGDDSFEDSSTQSCPICGGCLEGISIDDATRHVNACLDGNPIPLTAIEERKPEIPAPEVPAAEMSKRFARAAVPRPPQSNPFELDKEATGTKSAFSKLMSGNAEDSAWAAAAAAENAARGRPAYERTCPFYKIMPGFNVCVDAFRYGAVKGCEAYFLSHFHSDHYIGLTANWMHGPIYCSKVTGELVKKQLRTAAKWVVELEFEKSYDIPGSAGASVVMIPANHCPGSSMFIFQKPPEKGAKRGKRLLHCGDFRACPAHVEHELLKPDVMDSVSGKLKQQTIDICYLDTTYLNPRYSFPPQEDVIKACADLCANTSPDPKCKDDIWEKGQKEAGTQSVSKYFTSDHDGDDGAGETQQRKLGQRLLVICGTYSIGKERICVAIAKALKTKIFATPAKMRLCKELDDPELSSLLTSDAVGAQVHMQSLMEIRAETLQEYLDSYKPHFSRIMGFRPSGWNFRPGAGKSMPSNTSPTSIPTQQILHGKSWRTRFAYKDFVVGRGSTKEAMCFGVPYSEHSSFRELAMFVMSLRIERIIPTVNVGSDRSRRQMKAWLDRWAAERRRGGLVHALIEGRDDQDDKEAQIWEDKAGKGGGAWW